MFNTRTLVPLYNGYSSNVVHKYVHLYAVIHFTDYLV
jgi:hypothetical protein